MKVVLIKDVRNMGRAGSVIEVSDGHAVNFLFPRKLARPATTQAVQEASLRKQQVEDRKAIDAELLAKGITAINAAQVTISMKANEKGSLYKAVGPEEIAAAAKSQAGVEFPADVIKIEKPIKEVGTYQVKVASANHSGEFTIVVEAA